MTHARRVARTLPPTTTFPIAAVAAAAAAILVAAILAFTAFDPLGLQGPSVVAPDVNPAVIEAGRRWELQREAELGYVDPVVQSGRDWERQRRQQSASD